MPVGSALDDDLPPVHHSRPMSDLLSEWAQACSRTSVPSYVPPAQVPSPGSICITCPPPSRHCRGEIQASALANPALPSVRATVAAHKATAVRARRMGSSSGLIGWATSQLDPRSVPCFRHSSDCGRVTLASVGCRRSLTGPQTTRRATADLPPGPDPGNAAARRESAGCSGRRQVTAFADDQGLGLAGQHVATARGPCAARPVRAQRLPPGGRGAAGRPPSFRRAMTVAPVVTIAPAASQPPHPQKSFMLGPWTQHYRARKELPPAPRGQAVGDVEQGERHQETAVHLMI